MRFYDIIEKKKRGIPLSDEEISLSVRLFTEGEIPDYQMSAFLMAVYFQGMNDAECRALTEAVYLSGGRIDLSSLGNLSCDKHSSGGVGDKTTLIVAPLAATLGCKVAKMSGRGLGHTGGTVDKLEAIPGFKTTLSMDEFLDITKRVGVAVIGQSENLTPADKKLYALRDVTATVDSIPLITASIMGKKLAAGSKNITLDVKCGSGAFMKTREEAARLAESMVTIGNLCGRKTSAYVTDMSFPLGCAVGNICEVTEAIEILSGKGDKRLRELCIRLASSMAENTLGGEAQLWEERAAGALDDGSALSKFKEWIAAQGGDTSYIDNPRLFAEARHSHPVYARDEGYVTLCDTELVGLTAMSLGAGRQKKDDIIDFTAGIILNIRRGDYVRRGDLIGTLYSSVTDNFEKAEDMLLCAYTLCADRPEPLPIVLDVFK